ncbi:MAG: BatD family protein, partial [Pseudohongiella sp.]|nr:BatD family protein [Pseudohongiella sp.]
MKQLLSVSTFCFLSLLCAGSFAQQATVETNLDRTELARGETVTLRIRVHGQQGGVQIDLEPLRSQFEIVSTRSASHLRSINNRIESWTDYLLVLFPRELGEQQIPALVVGNQVTEAFTITVTEPTSTGLAAGNDVFLEAILSGDSVYVQEQLLFTVRLHYTIAGIRNPVFTEIAPDNAVVQMLGAPHQYEQLVDGVRYGIYEKNYVIFPQRSGELVIPDIVFRGELTDGSSNFVFR